MDTDGALYVADNGNARVVRWAAPCAPYERILPCSSVLMSHEVEELPEDDSVGIPLGPALAGASSSATARSSDSSLANYCYLILFNLNKKNNLGAILRSAAAFGVRLVLLVGRQGFKAFCKKSGQGVVPIENAATVSEAVAALKARHPAGELQVCGVEILSQAQSLHSSPFRGPTAFMVGNERGGLTREQIDHCDSFVYIPQFGGGVGSLNVACACSVVLYQFSAWASSTLTGLGFTEDQCPAMAVPHGAGSFALQGPRPLPPKMEGDAGGGRRLLLLAEEAHADDDSLDILIDFWTAMEMDLPDGVDHLETAKLKIIALSGTVVEEVAISEISTASVGLVALLAPRAAAQMRVDVSRLRFSLRGRVLDIWDTWQELGQPLELQLVVLPPCDEFKEELLEAVSGQDLDQVNEDSGMTLFSSTRIQGRSRLQDPNARSRDHMPAFMKASILGNPEIMVALYTAGANADAPDLTGATALHCAVRDARLETVRLLLNLRADLDARNKLGRTALFEAVGTGCLAMVKALVAAAADPNRVDREGGTPLRAAVAAGFLEVVEILVDAGAIVDLQNRDGSLLHVAAGHDRHEVVVALLESGAKTSYSDQQGATALHVAARQGQCEVLRTLLAANAEQLPDAHGVTPL
eukprot:symbB.v1.2.022052.t1/scaffold1928.1/size95828/10